MNKTEKGEKIEHLKDLLRAREEEYLIFGKTAEDTQQDNNIRKEIKELESRLLTKEMKH